MIPSDLVLETSRALLRPLQMNDFESFLELAKEDSEMWEYFTLNLGDEKQLRRWFEMAFAELNFEKIEFKTDVLNARARQGLKNVGGIEEGVLRSHMTMWNNRRRSSIYYSVLKDEWPRLKETIFAGIG